VRPVEADPVVRVVYGYIPLVNRVHHVHVHPVDVVVVVEVVVVPITALVSESDVPKTIVDAAVETDMPRPVPAVEAIAAPVIAPVARGP
jgi:hypothetical protein